MEIFILTTKTTISWKTKNKEMTKKVSTVSFTVTFWALQKAK